MSKILLSIDGGGIRSTIPAYILDILQRTINKPLYNCFDLIGGTSGGGIVALGLSFLSTKEIVRLYCLEGGNIFTKKHWWYKGIHRPKYCSFMLERFLQDKFENKNLLHIKTKTFVATYDIFNSYPVLLKSWDDNFQSIKVWQAIRATTAAPTFFEPYYVEINHKEHWLIDGGLYANNPALETYMLAKELWPNEEIILISLGTGTKKEKQLHNETKKWGLLKWLHPLFSVMFDGQDDIANMLLTNIAKTNTMFKYYRIQGELKLADYAMDNVNSNNILNLIKDAKIIIENNKVDLNNIVRLLRRHV